MEPFRATPIPLPAEAGSPSEALMDWKAISNSVLLVGLFVGMVTMFNQVNGRLDTMNGRIDDLNLRYRPYAS